MSEISQASTIVVDANVAIWAVVPPVSRFDTLGTFAQWQRRGARLVAPTFWLAECVSGVCGAAYAGAITADEARRAVEDLLALEVIVTPTSDQQCRSALAWAERLRQARAYDGFYLALAEELGAELWTADQRLANAARQLGLTWVRAIGG